MVRGNIMITVYIAGNFHGAQFPRMVHLYHFTGLIFADAHTHAHYVLYNRAYFVGLIFTVRRLSTKIVKIGSLKNSCYTVIIAKVMKLSHYIT